MKKSKEQLQAEQIVATMLKDYTPEEILYKAKRYADNFKYAVANRVAVAVMLATYYDRYEDFTEDDVKRVYQEYLDYYDSLMKGNERVFNLMLEINRMLDGDLLSAKICQAVQINAEKEEKENEY